MMRKDGLVLDFDVKFLFGVVSKIVSQGINVEYIVSFNYEEKGEMEKIGKESIGNHADTATSTHVGCAKVFIGSCAYDGLSNF